MHVFASAFLFVCIFNQIDAQRIDPVNIVFIWFDDLGFGDVRYNGGSYPTPILDNLANNDAIKLNFHYSEQVCSASRSALLTGRYSWLSGVNTVVTSYTNARFSTNNVLFPKLLDDHNWQNFIAGKWHVGYAYDENLPYNNGFKYGLYSHQNLQYYVRGAERNFRRLDNLWGAPSQRIIDSRARVFGSRNAVISVHDTWQIENYTETPTLINDTSYSEDIYTEAVKSFIREQDGTNPFFIYYSQWTPHATLVQPPEIRPDGSSMDYSICYDFWRNRTNGYGNCTLVNDAKCVFCKQMHYASLNIQEIIDEVRNNSNIDWDQTLVIITSDNGAQAIVENGYGNGTALPLRGMKATSYEGGLRTPAILKGGYIENIVNKNRFLDNNDTLCEYDGMIHISDWYHILMDITGISSRSDNDYNPDSDHSNLNVWEHIRCKCRGLLQRTRPADYCDTTYQQRDEMVMMRMCGDPDGDYYNGTKYFYSAYVRKGNWKLVVNASNSITDVCHNMSYISNKTISTTWQNYDGAYFLWPNQDYFNRVYQRRFEWNNVSATRLYKSDCLEALNGTQEIDQANYSAFIYEPSMLFNVGNDRVEACVVDNETVKQQLFEYLINRSLEYNVRNDPEIDANDLSAFQAQMDSYDCNSTYTIPWNGQTADSLNDIWRRFIAKQRDCERGVNRSGVSSAMDDIYFFEHKFDDDYDEYYFDHHNDNDKGKGNEVKHTKYSPKYSYWKIVMVSTMVSLMVVFAFHCLFGDVVANESQHKLLTGIDTDDSDDTDDTDDTDGSDDDTLDDDDANDDEEVVMIAL